MKYLKYIFLTLTFVASCVSTFGTSSFFAKSFVRSLFEIKTAQEKVLFNKKPDVTVHPKLKVLVWNIYKGDLFQQSPLPVNMDDFALVLLQEYDDSIARNFLPKAHHYFLPTFEWENSFTGVAIYSDRLLQKITPLHTKYREPFILTPKSSLIAYYKDILIINTHALNFVSDDEWIFELNQIAKTIGQAQKVIWAGDFNTWDSMRTNYLLNFMDSLQLIEVKFKEDLRTTHLGYPIDFIFTKGLKIKSSKSFDTSQSSDHNAISVEFN